MRATAVDSMVMDVLTDCGPVINMVAPGKADGSESEFADAVNETVRGDCWTGGSGSEATDGTSRTEGVSRAVDEVAVCDTMYSPAVETYDEYKWPKIGRIPMWALVEQRCAMAQVAMWMLER